MSLQEFPHIRLACVGCWCSVVSVLQVNVSVLTCPDCLMSNLSCKSDCKCSVCILFSYIPTTVGEWVLHSNVIKSVPGILGQEKP